MANEKPNGKLITFLGWSPELFSAKTEKRGLILRTISGDEKDIWETRKTLVSYSGLSAATLGKLVGLGIARVKAGSQNTRQSLDDLDAYIERILLPGYNALIGYAMRKAKFYNEISQNQDRFFDRDMAAWAKRILEINPKPWHVAKKGVGDEPGKAV